MKKLMQSNMHIDREAKLGRTDLGLFVMLSNDTNVSQIGLFLKGT